MVEIITHNDQIQIKRIRIISICISLVIFFHFLAKIPPRIAYSQIIQAAYQIFFVMMVAIGAQKKRIKAIIEMVVVLMYHGICKYFLLYVLFELGASFICMLLYLCLG